VYAIFSLLTKEPKWYDIQGQFRHEEPCKLCAAMPGEIDVQWSEMSAEECDGMRTEFISVALLPKWLASLSKGGLVNAGELLVSAIKEFEGYFLAFNGAMLYILAAITSRNLRSKFVRIQHLLTFRLR
jgi:hypothetical protein